MAWLVIGLTILVALAPEVRTQAPAAAGTQAAGTAGAASTATMTNQPQHPFCNTPPFAQTPKMPIFHMDVKTGFLNGYRSNQSVIVEITAKYPEVWRINQLFIHVPDNDPYVYRGRGNDYRYHKVVGHWAWHLLRSNTDPDVGGTQPVDCGGISSYGPFGMLTSMGAHAAMEMKRADDPSNPHRGYTKIVAKWVPPSNWENIIYRKMITIQAFVTFEKTPPGVGQNNPYQQPQISFTGYHRPKPARWVKKEATLLNLDYIDVHNFLIMKFGPMYQQYFGAPKPVATEL